MRVLKPSTLSVLLAASSNAQPLASGPDQWASCSPFGASLALENVTVNFAEFVPAGTNLSLSQDYGLDSCEQPFQLVSVDLCRVAMYVATTDRSGITLEAWLPSNWTGRFLSTGNGGVSGCIQYYDLAYASGFGFATVGANNGHNGTRGHAFQDNTDVVRDFADRSMHTGVVVGKQVTELFYGTAHSKSYYLGCSTGGRQGLKAVQTYPEDFDGVVVGAPGLNFPSLTSWSARFFTLFGVEGDATFVSVDQWMGLVRPEMFRQCDGIDGVLDGVLEDPDLCQFNPGTLLCPAAGNSAAADCLSEEQVGAVAKVYEDYYGVDGDLINPRMQPGEESVAVSLYYTGGSFSYSDDWFRYVVYNDSSWDPATYTIQDAKAAKDQNPFNIATWEGDISAFQKSGGKLLHYHGLADGIITSTNSPLYYEHVSQTMGMSSSELDDFYRLFRVSGMGHCTGGTGAHLIGNQLEQLSTADPQDNVLLRMVEWVENGNGPETIRGTKYVNDDRSQGVELVREHCKYPKKNTLVDPANYHKAEAWNCV